MNGAGNSMLRAGGWVGSKVLLKSCVMKMARCIGSIDVRMSHHYISFLDDRFYDNFPTVSATSESRVLFGCTDDEMSRTLTEVEYARDIPA